MVDLFLANIYLFWWWGIQFLEIAGIRLCHKTQKYLLFQKSNTKFLCMKWKNKSFVAFEQKILLTMAQGGIDQSQQVA